MNLGSAIAVLTPIAALGVSLSVGRIGSAHRRPIGFACLAVGAVALLVAAFYA